MKYDKNNVTSNQSSHNYWHAIHSFYLLDSILQNSSNTLEKNNRPEPIYMTVHLKYFSEILCKKIYLYFKLATGDKTKIAIPIPNVTCDADGRYHILMTSPDYVFTAEYSAPAPLVASGFVLTVSMEVSSSGAVAEPSPLESSSLLTASGGPLKKINII